MSYYHIIIATENRNPTISTEYLAYIGEVRYDTYTDEDGETYPKQVYVTEDDPASWETRISEQPNPRLATPILEQLHSFSAAGLPENLDDPQFVMVAEWDGASPYVICHKGDYSSRTMEYAGWPDLTETQWAALQNSTEGFL